MDHTGEMSVVVVEAVYQQPVHHRGVAKTEAQGKTDNGLITSATQRLHRGCRTSGELERRRGMRYADRVDDEHLGLIDNCPRQIVELHSCREVPENVRQRSRGGLCHGLRPNIAR